MATTKRKETSELERILQISMPADEYREMWERSHELHRREVEALERIATLLANPPNRNHRS